MDANEEAIPIETRRAVYEFTLSLYEALEALPERGVLVSDIEAAANKVLGEVARFPVFEEKDKVIKDIVGDLKAMKALLGVIRDMSFLERHKAVTILDECTKLEGLFQEMNAEMAETKEANRKKIFEANSIIAKPAIEAMKEAVPQMSIANVLKEKFGNTSAGSFEEHPSDIRLESVEREDPFSETQAERNLPPPEASVERRSDYEPQNEPGMSLRQKAIMEVLKRRAKITVGDLGLLFSGRVSKKTLQRDLQDLVEKNIVKRRGDRRWASYYI